MNAGCRPASPRAAGLRVPTKTSVFYLDVCRVVPPVDGPFRCIRATTEQLRAFAGYCGCGQLPVRAGWSAFALPPPADQPRPYRAAPEGFFSLEVDAAGTNLLATAISKYCSTSSSVCSSTAGFPAPQSSPSGRKRPPDRALRCARSSARWCSGWRGRLIRLDERQAVRGTYANAGTCDRRHESALPTAGGLRPARIQDVASAWCASLRAAELYTGLRPKFGVCAQRNAARMTAAGSPRW
jgi:hypothetical protein